MSTPLANKTTISSRNKISQLNGGNSEEVLISKTCVKTSMQPPSQIARNRALRPPNPPVASTNGTSTITTTSSRLANLANGLPSHLRNGGITKPTSTYVSKTPGPGGNGSNSNNIRTNQKHAVTSSSRLVPHTTNKIPAKLATSTRPTTTTTTSSRISATATTTPHSRLTNITQPLNSRSSSILSSVSSATTHTSTKRPLLSSIGGVGGRNSTSNKPVTSNHIPDTNTLRKGLAKFSNPIECQRQFQALSLKIRQSSEIIEAREKEIDELQERLKRSIDMGVGYATTVQYFAVKLKLDSETNLLEECEQLHNRVQELSIGESRFNEKLKAVEDDFKNQLQVEYDLKENLEKELEGTKIAHSEIIQKSEEAHKNELDDLKEKHSIIEKELKEKVEILQSELDSKLKELTDLRNEHELLINSFNKLEESLTKDKDARVKIAHEKISQLQKDVESLNSVLDMRSEKIHLLEKDQMLLAEVQNELMTSKDLNRALHQQLESVNAALDKKREQFENLMVDHEKVSQELKRERKERRRMTMRTEQLEYVLNESCAAESTMGFNSTLRDIDSADHLV